MKDKDTKLLEEALDTVINESDLRAFYKFLDIAGLNKNKILSWEAAFRKLGDTFHTKSDIIEMFRRTPIPTPLVRQLINIKEYQDLERG